MLSAQMYRVLRANAETLSYVQDYTVSALTDAAQPAPRAGYDRTALKSRRHNS